MWREVPGVVGADLNISPDSYRDLRFSLFYSIPLAKYWNIILNTPLQLVYTSFPNYL
jgi:hypothetical protein